MKRIFLLLLAFSTFAPTTLTAVNLHACIECHGKHFEKSAMGLSRIVKDLNKEELVTALKIYTDDAPHAGMMQIVMSNQLAKFTEIEIAEIVENILDDNITDVVEVVKKEDISEIEVDLSMCISCHGKNFEKLAMGSSIVVAKMSKEELKVSLHGYKNSTYGRSKEALMLNQVIELSEDEIDAMAEKIFTKYHK